MKGGGSKPKTTLDLTITGTEEEREDRWAFTCNELGFTVYGHTREEASQAVSEALVAFVHSFGDDVLLRNYLDKKGVKHRFVSSTDRPQVQSWQREFEVPITGQNYAAPWN